MNKLILLALALMALPAAGQVTTSLDPATGMVVTRTVRPIADALAECRGLGYAASNCGMVPGACSPSASEDDLLPRLCSTPGASCQAQIDALLRRQDVTQADVCPPANPGAAWDAPCSAATVAVGLRPADDDEEIPDLDACMILIRMNAEAQQAPRTKAGRSRRLPKPVPYTVDLEQGGR